ncbi:MAG: thiol reductant ABC exporter subunit CydC [Bifidobacteriaceae bacterium]|nr:thiol reductant ABC exporter subunit CydC [Bifidobacteriaceae bacterium]
MTPDPLWRAIRLTGLRPLALARAVLAGSATLISSVGLAAFSAWLIVRASQMPPVLTLQIAVVMVRVFGISRGVFRYLERLAAHRVALNGMTELRVRIYSLLAAGRPSAAASLRRGDLLARVGADVDDVGDLVVRGVVPVLVAVVLAGVSAAILAAFIPLAGLVLLALLIAAGVLAPVLTLRAARLAELDASAARSRVSAAALSVLDHGDELAVSGRMKRTMAELASGERQLDRALDKAAGPSALAAGVTEAAIGLAIGSSFWFGLTGLAAGALSPTDLAVVVLTPLASFEAVSGLPAAAAQIYRSRAAASRIVALVDAAAPEAGAPETGAGQGGAGEASTGEASTGEASRDGGAGDGIVHIEIPAEAPLVARGLACGWTAGRDVLRDVDLSVAPGQAVALVGPSGSGKTTLLATLAGLLAPRAGQVLVGRGRLSDLGREQTAQTVAFIAEDAHIFATTVLENLRVVRGDVTPGEAAEALRLAGLDQWLAELPDGVDTLLGPGGGTVSGGERRRLLVARALLSPARFLLLDEPGEHLDPASADALTAQLLGLAEATGRGVLLVTHRLTALGGADQVVELADGRIAASGTHLDLLAGSPAYRWAADAEDLED